MSSPKFGALGGRSVSLTPTFTVARRPFTALATLLLVAVGACSDLTGIDPQAVQPRPTVEGPSLAVSATGVTYYVSPSGKNSNAGTSPSKPWRDVRRVNSSSFKAGDQVLFQGGAVFSGAITLSTDDKGSAVAPIVLGSYGTGRATINAGSGTAITIYNTSGIVLRNLAVVGSGSTTNTGSGINVYSDLSGGVKLPFIRIDSVDASGFGNFGILIGSWNASSGFSDVRVTYSAAHDNGKGGVSTYAQVPYVHQNFYFGHLLAYRNSGIAAATSNTGSGITMGSVVGGMIERSVARENGWLCTASEGPVGIWTYDSDGIVIQFNESYRNRTAGPSDGGGFDLDQNTRNAVVQYNYSHDNDGPGYLLSQSLNNSNHSGNTVRYNVSENDARRNGTGAIVIWGRTIGAEIHNNSIYVSPAASGAPKAFFLYNATIPAQDVQRVHVRNNIFYAAGGVTALSVSADQINGAVDLRFEGNNYFGGGTAPRITWGNTTYSGIGPWRTASTQEMLAGVAVGSQVDPRFTAPGSGGTIGDADLLSSLTAYRLLATSPMVDRGLDLTALFRLSVGPTDFFGGALPFGPAYDAGAHERR